MSASETLLRIPLNRPPKKTWAQSFQSWTQEIASSQLELESTFLPLSSDATPAVHPNVSWCLETFQEEFSGENFLSLALPGGTVWEIQIKL